MVREGASGCYHTDANSHRVPGSSLTNLSSHAFSSARLPPACARQYSITLCKARPVMLSRTTVAPSASPSTKKRKDRFDEKMREEEKHNKTECNDSEEMNKL